jgi:hypothetical protein
LRSEIAGRDEDMGHVVRLDDQDTQNGASAGHATGNMGRGSQMVSHANSLTGDIYAKGRPVTCGVRIDRCRVVSRDPVTSPARQAPRALT